MAFAEDGCGGRTDHGADRRESMRSALSAGGVDGRPAAGRADLKRVGRLVDDVIHRPCRHAGRQGAGRAEDHGHAVLQIVSSFCDNGRRGDGHGRRPRINISSAPHFGKRAGLCRFPQDVEPVKGLHHRDIVGRLNGLIAGITHRVHRVCRRGVPPEVGFAWPTHHDILVGVLVILGSEDAGGEDAPAVGCLDQRTLVGDEGAGGVGGRRAGHGVLKSSAAGRGDDEVAVVFAGVCAGRPTDVDRGCPGVAVRGCRGHGRSGGAECNRGNRHVGGEVEGQGKRFVRRADGIGQPLRPLAGLRRAALQAHVDTVLQHARRQGQRVQARSEAKESLVAVTLDWRVDGH